MENNNGLSPEIMKLVEHAKNNQKNCGELSLDDLEKVSGGAVPSSFNVSGGEMNRQSLFNLIKQIEKYLGPDTALLMLKDIFAAEGYTNTTMLEYAYKHYSDCEGFFYFLEHGLN